MIPVGEAPLYHDERDWCRLVQNKHRLDPLLVGSLLNMLEKAMTEAGRPLERTYVRRWNADGDPIGPDQRMSVEAGYALERVCERVRKALDLAIEEEVGR